MGKRSQPHTTNKKAHTLPAKGLPLLCEPRPDPCPLVESPADEPRLGLRGGQAGGRMVLCSGQTMASTGPLQCICTDMET